jgi:hypothetical protein
MDALPLLQWPLGLEARYKTLVEISRSLVRNLARNDILASLADLIWRIAPFERIGLMIFEPETDSRRIFANAGRSHSLLSRVGAEVTRQLQSYAWQAFDWQRPARAAPTWGVGRACRSNGKSIGTLNLASEVPRARW